MTDSVALEEMADEIRRIYGTGANDVQTRMRDFLEKKLGHLAHEEKVAYVDKLAAFFRSDQTGAGSLENEEVLTRICALLLGRKVSSDDLTSSELIERLADSLNTIFDTLNQLVTLIQNTLKGESGNEETIRQVIGTHMGGEDRTESLESYLGQIKKAFWVAQEAFRKAAHDQFGQVLTELDPGVMQEQGKGFKFGPMRKAESFDMFEEKYGKIRQWFDSGRFNEEFLRNFERNAQKLSSH